jgi:dolichol-phosphate mannosyltransferase
MACRCRPSTKSIPTVVLLLILAIFSVNLLPDFSTYSAASSLSADESSSSCIGSGAGGDDRETCASTVLPTNENDIDNSRSGSGNNITMLYSIILPTYNERDNLPIITQFIHDTFTASQLSYEIVVVDDSSPDNTLEVAQSLQQLFGRDHFRIVSRPGKLGLGSAYSAGLKASTGQRIILMDADLSHHPKYIPRMIDVMDNKVVEGSFSKKKNKPDIVSGTRYGRGGGVSGWDTYRKLTSCGANFLATFLLRTGGASDLTGSFRLYERHAIERILPQVKCTGYAFQMEILVRAHKAGMTIGEVPIVFVDRIYGESKLGANEIIMYLKGLLNLFLTT